MHLICRYVRDVFSCQQRYVSLRGMRHGWKRKNPKANNISQCSGQLAWSWKLPRFEVVRFCAHRPREARLQTSENPLFLPIFKLTFYQIGIICSMFGPVSDARVEHPSINATDKIKLCVPSLLTIDATCSPLAGGGRSSPRLVAPHQPCRCLVAPWYPAPRWSPSSLCRVANGGPSCSPLLCTAWCVRLWFGSCAGHNPPCAWKGSECHWFRSHAASLCGAVRISLYKTSPCRAHLHKITHETKASEKGAISKTTCAYSFSLQCSPFGHIFSRHTRAHTSTEGRKHLSEPTVGQMKWRNEKMHQKSDSNAFQWAHSAALYMLHTCKAKTTEVDTTTGQTPFF